MASGALWVGPDRLRVLVVCTANRCRSPAAAEMLRRRSRGAVEVASAGFLESGQPMPLRGLETLQTFGFDLSEHRSHQLTSQDIDDAQLVLGMERRHVRNVLDIRPGAWERTFTLKDFVHRAEKIGRRAPGADFGDWLTRVGIGRTPHDVVGKSRADDIADPMGRSARAWMTAVEEIDQFVGQVTPLLVGSP